MTKRTMSNKMYLRALVVTAILLLLTVLCYWSKSLQLYKAQKEITQLERQKGEYKTFLNEKNEVVAIQNQNIVNLKTALKEARLDGEKWKSIKSKVKIETKFIFDTIFVSYRDTIYISDTIYPKGTINVPKRFHKKDSLYEIGGLVLLDGIKIDTLIIPNDMSVTIGSQKTKWWKKAVPIVQVKNSNKYLTVQSMDNIVVENKKKIYQKNSFWALIGLTLGLSSIYFLN